MSQPYLPISVEEIAAITTVDHWTNRRVTFSFPSSGVRKKVLKVCVSVLQLPFVVGDKERCKGGGAASMVSECPKER
jgi:hypothetical protein